MGWNESVRRRALRSTVVRMEPHWNRPPGPGGADPNLPPALRRFVSACEVGGAWIVAAARALQSAGGRTRRAAHRAVDRLPGPLRGRPVVAAVTAVVLLVCAAVAAIPLAGLSDEAVALVGQRLFGVDDLPPIDGPAERSVVLDAAGNELGVLAGAENRKIVPLDRIPPVLRDAVIAIEDDDFRRHEGIDTSAIVRAATRNVLAMDVEQGASTITQQYVKNALLSSEQSLDRKVTEATWAVRLEERLTKDEILGRYLNIAYFGNGAYGVAAASERYFGRPVEDLDLPRAALLAGLVQRPGATDPLTRPAAAEARRDVVLDRMQAHGMIDAGDAETARVPVKDLLEPTTPPRPPHDFFMQHVKQQLLAAPELGATRDERAGRLFEGGLTIRTTLDVRMQEAAEAAIAEHVDDPAADPLAGIVSLQPGRGAVRVMAVGPKAFGACDGAPNECDKTKVNPLAPGLGGSGRQAGSAFKPFVLAAALRDGIDPDWHTDVSSGQSVPGCGSYAPENYDHSGGVDDVVEGITESNNVFHVKLAEAVGQEHVAATATDLGIDTPLQAQCSLALGTADTFPIDMAEAYATFASGGVRCTPYTVLEVLDADERQLLHREPDCERVLDEEHAETMTTLLRYVTTFGTATGARIDRAVAAKTGTTDDNHDAWLVGFTPQLATAAWVGYEQPEPMEGILGYDSISGGTVPASMWATFMRAALDPLDVADLPLLSLDRYRQPPCPSAKKGNNEDKKDKKKQKKDDKNKDDKNKDDEDDSQAAGSATLAAPAPGPPTDADREGDRFDRASRTLWTGTDGDSFEPGHQPERCVPQGSSRR